MQRTPGCVELVKRCEITGFAGLHRMLLAPRRGGPPGLVAEVAQAQQAGVAGVRHHPGEGLIEPWCLQAVEVVGVQFVVDA
ncbi:MAG: hypothetical protein EBU81_05505, partial [Proteobacteria bacterium]|nr:hypothetical protein [Pseudomonadota bacterium]